MAITGNYQLPIFTFTVKVNSDLVMNGTAYEILGHYLDSLSGSIYLGSAKGFVFVEHNGEVHFLSPVECTEYVSIFYSNGFLEVYTIWGPGGENGVRLLADTSRVSVFSRKDDLYILIEPHGSYEMVNGVIGVFLRGAKDMESTLRSAINSLEIRRKGEDGIIELARGQSF